MNFIKKHWFSGLLILIVCCFFALFLVLIISPKQDDKNRGFIKCTQQMVDELSDCEKKIWCSIKAIGNNTLCDIKIIAEGFTLWLDDKQPYPWSNYIFKPEIMETSVFDEEARKEYLKNHPNVEADMRQLDRLRKELENEENNDQTISEEMLPKEIVQDEKQQK